MTKNYGKNNKGFQRANDNRKAEKVRSLMLKAGKHRKHGGPDLTATEKEWLSQNRPY